MFNNVFWFVVGLTAVGVGIGMISAAWAFIIMGHYIVLLALISALLENLSKSRKRPEPRTEVKHESAIRHP